MKPSGHLTRTAPLQRYTRLVGNPKTAQEWRDRSRRNAAARCSKPAVPASTAKKPRKKTGSRTGEDYGRKVVRGRSHGLCELRIPPLCTGWAQEWSHRLKRSQGGTWAPSNGNDACIPCHEAITNTRGRRQEFEDNGWIVPRGQDPATTPVLMGALGGVVLEIPALVLLTDDGQYREAGE